MITKKILEDNEKYTFAHWTGNTKFTGCQCIKDCYCANNFISESVNHYTVKRKLGKKPKRFQFESMQQALVFIESL
jgi:hypothetical protein